MKHELKIKPGDRYTKNGKTVEVDFVRDGMVFYRKWGRFEWGRVHKSGPFFFQMTVENFTRQIKELKGKK
jgi:hypothetical protein